MKVDPIIAVKDVNTSAEWYQNVFGCTRSHGGSEFEVMKLDDQVLICLHKWGEHEHPTMTDSSIIPGNGLILYFKTANLEEVRENVRQIDYPVLQETHSNPNSHKMEFSLRDPDGYYLTVTEFHNF